MKYKKLLSPIKIAGKTVKNRIAMAPMGTSLQAIDGTVTKEMVDYFELRAKGGTGLIISPFTSVDERYRAITIGLDSPLKVAYISRLAEAIKFHGTRFILQISHFGGKIPSFLTGRQPIAPSSFESPIYPDTPKEMTIKEIEEMIERYINTANLAKSAGCDGVELHGAHGYLIGQFVSPYTNRRDDDFGGSFENRMKFVTRIYEGVRSSCGDDFIIGYKYSAYEHLEGGVKEELAVKIAQYMENLGIDYVHVSAFSSTLPGMVDTELQSVPTIYIDKQGSLLPIAQSVKKAIKDTPVLATGGINDPDAVEKFLQEDSCDMTVLGRALIADPEWVNKVKDGGIIRRCIKCQECYKRVINLRWVKCTLNPTTCDDARYEDFLDNKAGKSKKVAIIGAGPAGLEAAIRSKQRGHKVALFEAKDEIGGNLRVAAIPDFKKELKALIETFKKELDLQGIKPVLNKKVSDLNDISVDNKKPDVVLIAIGAKQIIPEIKGIENNNVTNVLDFYKDPKKDIGKKIVIIGAGDVGAELALFLLRKDKEVTIVDIMDEEEMLIDELMPYRSGIYTMIKKEGAKILNSTYIEKIKDSDLFVKDKNGNKKIIESDRIIVSAGFTCNDKEIDRLKNIFSEDIAEVYAIGDCKDPGRLYKAIHSATETAWRL